MFSFARQTKRWTVGPSGHNGFAVFVAVVTEDDMLRKTINESSEPVVGRLGICKYAQRMHLV